MLVIYLYMSIYCKHLLQSICLLTSVLHTSHLQPCTWDSGRVIIDSIYAQLFFTSMSPISLLFLKFIFLKYELTCNACPFLRGAMPISTSIHSLNLSGQAAFLLCHLFFVSGISLLLCFNCF